MPIPRARLDLLLAVVSSALSLTMVMSSRVDARTVGVVADDQSRKVVMFDADANIVLGSVQLPPGGQGTGDCAMTGDGTTAFVTDFTSRLWVIDLTTSPPSLAAGTNPILISNYGEDIGVTPDQKYLVVSDGYASQPLSVVDIANRVEVSTMALAPDWNSVDVASDGSVLATSVTTGLVYRLTVDATGHLTDTGETLFSGAPGFDVGPNNVFASPQAHSGVVINRSLCQMRSFTIPGLTLVSITTVSGGSGLGLCGVVNPAGNRVYARSNPGLVEAFPFDAQTGQMGDSTLFTISISTAQSFFGMDQMAIHPDGSRLYVPQPNALNVYDAATGALVASITDPGLIAPTGVCFASVPFVANHPPATDAARALVSELWPANHDLEPVTIVGVTDPDTDAVTITVTGVTQDEPLDDLGDGTTCPDATIAGGAASVRAERSGRGNGRVYEISFVADDGRGGSTPGSVKVHVPHDHRGQAFTDDGQTVNSLGSCDSVGFRIMSPSAAYLAVPGAPCVVRYQVPAGSGDHVTLLASFDQGTTWHIDVRNAANTGEILWTVPSEATDSALVAVANVTEGSTGSFEVTRVLGESDFFRIASPLAVPPAVAVLDFAPIHPNPTAGNARIRFALPRAGEVALEAFDVHGRKVKTFASGPQEAGWHEVSWAGDTDSGERVGAGLFFISLRVGEQELTHSVVRLR
jgi:hypothetical protein